MYRAVILPSASLASHSSTVEAIWSKARYRGDISCGTNNNIEHNATNLRNFNRHIAKWIITFFILFLSLNSIAHPMPNSIVLLDIKSKTVQAELQLPLNEMELAFGHNINSNTSTLVARSGKELEAYILQHIHPVSNNGKAWTVKIMGMHVKPAEQTATGPYNELVAYLQLIPPEGESVRSFILNYDIIIHQVVTHSTLLSVRQDWETGKTGDNNTEIGLISLDTKSNTIKSFIVNEQPGSNWRGFTSMVNLGIDHIAAGTDHLLFLLTLLLPATLLVQNKRWAGFKGTKNSIKKLLSIITAFTIGHSLTLIAGAAGWFHFSSQPIEILIAVSILVSAIHAIKPLFPGKEILVAGGFGLIHGLAFAATLSNLDLEAGKMALSILGFNTGIELMQLFVIVITVPWLILLSRIEVYKWIRITGAVMAGIAALAWILERISMKANLITSAVQNLSGYGLWLIALLALISTNIFLNSKRKNTNPAFTAIHGTIGENKI